MHQRATKKLASTLLLCINISSGIGKIASTILLLNNIKTGIGRIASALLLYSNSSPAVGFEKLHQYFCFASTAHQGLGRLQQHFCFASTAHQGLGKLHQHFCFALTAHQGLGVQSKHVFAVEQWSVGRADGIVRQIDLQTIAHARKHFHSLYCLLGGLLSSNWHGVYSQFVMFTNCLKEQHYCSAQIACSSLLSTLLSLNH